MKFTGKPFAALLPFLLFDACLIAKRRRRFRRVERKRLGESREY
jgi:hypothetical protein